MNKSMKVIGFVGLLLNSSIAMADFDLGFLHTDKDGTQKCVSREGKIIVRTPYSSDRSIELESRSIKVELAQDVKSVFDEVFSTDLSIEDYVESSVYGAIDYRSKIDQKFCNQAIAAARKALSSAVQNFSLGIEMRCQRIFYLANGNPAIDALSELFPIDYTKKLDREVADKVKEEKKKNDRLGKKSVKLTQQQVTKLQKVLSDLVLLDQSCAETYDNITVTESNYKKFQDAYDQLDQDLKKIEKQVGQIK